MHHHEHDPLPPGDLMASVTLIRALRILLVRRNHPVIHKQATRALIARILQILRGQNEAH